MSNPQTGFRGVFLSRIGLKAAEPGDGRHIDWEIGERVMVTSGIDKGRVLVITSDRMSHDALSGQRDPYVREGYFEDDPTKERWAKAEQHLWLADAERFSDA